jgi:hypothetical protein
MEDPGRMGMKQIQRDVDVGPMYEYGGVKVSDPHISPEVQEGFAMNLIVPDAVQELQVGIS